MGKVTAEELAEQFHEIYEEIAPAHGYKTRDGTAVPWEELPMNNKMLMIMTCRIILLRAADGKIQF